MTDSTVGNVIGAHDIFEDAFVHADGRADHARAHVSHVRHFEQTLDRSIFSERSMQERKINIYFGKFI